MVKLIRLSIEFKQQVLDYKNEFIENGDDLAGTSYLRDYDNYEQWLDFILDNEQEDTKHTEVTADVFLAISQEDNRLIGIINIRHTLNDYLYNYGGHIGYSVKRDERKKGYATQMLKNALDICKNIGLKKILLTCNADNVASAKTIKKCGGILENEVNDGETLIQRYWIKL